MPRCVRKLEDRFKTPFELITHLCDACAETRIGELKCPTCGVCHSMKKKGHTHQLLTSPIDLLKRWSVHRQSKPGRNAGSTLVPTNNHMQAQETEIAGESESSIDTDMPRQSELHSEPPRYELQDTRRNIHEAPVQSEKHSLTQAPLYGNIGEPFFYQNIHQNSFGHPSPFQPPMKQFSGSDISTLFGTSSIHEQDTGKQLSIDTMPFPPSNGSYRNSHAGQAGHNQTIMTNNDRWLSESHLTESPGGVESLSLDQALWEGQASHLRSNHHMAPLLHETTSLPDAAEAATNELRHEIGAMMSTPGSMVFQGQVQGQGFNPFGVGNNSCDSYGSNTTDEISGHSMGRMAVENEMMSVTIENASNHKRIPRAFAATERRTAKVTKPSRKPTRSRAARNTTGNAADRSMTPVDELKCPYWPCDYKPSGKHRKNYRGHYERHLLKHDPEAISTCPVLGCTQEFRGARNDNMQDHLRRMHPNTTFETQATLKFRRQNKRTIRQTANTGMDLASGSSGTLGSRGQSRTASADDSFGGVDMNGPPAVLMGISGEISSDMGQMEDVGNLSRAHSGEDYVLPTGPGDVMDRQGILGDIPWARYGQQDFSIWRSG